MRILSTLSLVLISILFFFFLHPSFATRTPQEHCHLHEKMVEAADATVTYHTAESAFEAVLSCRHPHSLDLWREDFIANKGKGTLLPILHFLASKNDADAIRTLVSLHKEKGWDSFMFEKMNQCLPGGQDRSPLSIACEKGHYEAIKALLEYPDTHIDHRMTSNASPIVLAASEGHMNIVKLLLAHSHEQIGVRCIHFAMAKYWNEATKSFMTVTPETVANHRGHNDIAELLSIFQADSIQRKQIRNQLRKELALSLPPYMIDE